MSKESRLSRFLYVEATGGMLTIRTKGELVKIRLLGASCTTDVGEALYQDRNCITVSLEKGKFGVIALSVSVDGKFFGRGLFKIHWIGQDSEKIWLDLDKEFVSEKGEMSENGLDIGDIFFDVMSTYRVPFVFWNDGILNVEQQKVTLDVLKSRFKIFYDGNVFCRYIVGDADVNDLETAALQYKLDSNPDFRKEIAGKFVKFGVLENKYLEQMSKIDQLDKEILNLRVLVEQFKILIEAIKQVAIEPCMFWWNKTKKIRQSISDFKKTQQTKAVK